MDNTELGLVIFTIILIAVIIIGMPLSAYMSCDAKAKAMGMRSDWGLVKGCIIEHKPGQWIPLENYRALEK